MEEKNGQMGRERAANLTKDAFLVLSSVFILSVASPRPSPSNHTLSPQRELQHGPPISAFRTA